MSKKTRLSKQKYDLTQPIPNSYEELLEHFMELRNDYHRSLTDTLRFRDNMMRFMGMAYGAGCDIGDVSEFIDMKTMEPRPYTMDMTPERGVIKFHADKDSGCQMAIPKHRKLHGVGVAYKPNEGKISVRLEYEDR